MTESSNPKKSPRISAELTEKVAACFDQFVNSPRYPLFEGLRISEFVKSKNSPYRNFSFVELISEGAEHATNLPKLKPAHVEELIRAISSLVGLEVEKPAPTIIQFPGLPDRSHQTSRPVMSSVEAEERLTVALEKLRVHPKLNELSVRTVGEFWQKDWARAPFEEAMTFKQLSQLRPRSLLEKRSFSTQKLLHLIQALDSALSGREPQTEAIIPVAQTTTNAPTTAVSTGLPCFESALSLCRRYQEMAAQCTDALQAMVLAQSFDPPLSECRAILLLDENEVAVLTERSGCTAQIIQGIQKIARSRLRQADDWRR